MPTLNLEFVRRQFPAFSEPTLEGWAFFENAGGSYACAAVIDRLHRYYRETKVQPYGSYPASIRAGNKMNEAYRRLAGYLNVGEDEVHFGPSTSQNTYVLARAFRDTWQSGDEVIVTNQDHEANSGCWRRLADTGIVVREWRIDPKTGMLNPDDLDPLLSDRTRLVAFPHCSNIVGHINPVADIAAKAHAVGARIIVDGVAAAPHGLPDVAALEADVYLFSLYKTYGPHQGLMVVRAPLLAALSNQGHFFNAEVKRKKLIPAGPDHGQIAAAAGIADYLDALYNHHFTEPVPATTEAEVDAGERGRRLRKLFRQAEQAQLAPLLEWLRHRDDVRIVGPADATQRVPTVSVTTHKHTTASVARALAAHRIMAGHGHFYAVRVLDGVGVPREPGVLRMSFVHYTTADEVTRLIEALDQIL